MGALARIERFLGWEALSPIAIGILLVTLDASVIQCICVLVVFAQYSVKIDQIHAQAGVTRMGGDGEAGSVAEGDSTRSRRDAPNPSLDPQDQTP